MTESDNNQDDSKERWDRTESVRPPLDYFFLPLCLSFQTPLFFFTVVIVTIAVMTDPIRPQWWLEELHWIDFVGRVVLLVGFIGMCCRKEWALWLTVVVQIIWTFWIIAALSMSEPDPLVPLGYVCLAYDILIITACFFALWRCWQFTKNQRIFPSLSAGVPAK
jgi:hypothetical protein